MGRADPCSRRASRSDGIRGLRASTASSHSAGASRATDSPKSLPSSCADWTASVSETGPEDDGWPGVGCGPLYGPFCGGT